MSMKRRPQFPFSPFLSSVLADLLYSVGSFDRSPCPAKALVHQCCLINSAIVEDIMHSNVNRRYSKGNEASDWEPNRSAAYMGLG